MIGILLASILGPFSVEVSPEVRSSYQSFGKLVEDRPMQLTSVRVKYATEDFGKFGIRNWDVSSLTDRRHDVHRHALYHTEHCLTWDYDWEIAKDWRLDSELMFGWAIYAGFKDDASNRSYCYWQVDQSLENPYIVPFYRFSRVVTGYDYIYFKAGLRRKFDLPSNWYVTPSVFLEGGNKRNYRRVFGQNIHGSWDSAGCSSISFRLEAGYRCSDYLTAFVFVEQYEVIGAETRDTNGASPNRCAHNDWTHGGIGLRFLF